MTECTHMVADQVETKICYKCGAKDHSVTQCPDRGRIQGYPFSKCFICKEVGHVR